ncbi:MAG: hypothetical protein ACSW8B_00255 [bacterium]
MEQSIKRINRMGHIGQIITLIMKIVLIIVLLLSIALTVFVSRIPSDSITVDMNADAEVVCNYGPLKDFLQLGPIEGLKEAVTFNVDHFQFKIDQLEEKDQQLFIKAKAQGELFNNRDLLPMMISTSVKVFLLLVCVFAFSALAKALRYCRSPFEDQVITKMRHLAWALIPWIVASSTDFSLPQGIHVQVNIGMLLPVFIILVLIYIFRYGAILQRESDETL